MAFISRVPSCALIGGAGRISLGFQAPVVQDQRWFNYSNCTKLEGFITRRSRIPSATSLAQTAELEAFGITETGKFSLSDDELLSQGYELHRSMESIDLDELNELFVKVGFPRRQNEKLRRALEHTGSMLWITKSNQIIAFARATGDEVFNAIIWDVVVDPSFQGLGLGKAVMERLMADLRRKGISNIVLYAEPNVLGFYKPLGFVVDPDGIRAMSLSRRRRQ